MFVIGGMTLLERLYEYYATEERISLFCHMNGMEVGWINFVVENIYEEGGIVRIETEDSYIRLNHTLFVETPDEEGEKFVHGNDYILLLKEDGENCF